MKNIYLSNIELEEKIDNFLDRKIHVDFAHDRAFVSFVESIEEQL